MDGGDEDTAAAMDAEGDVESDAGDDGPSTGPSAMMSFFVTSVGNGTNGGNYGGLDGADAQCKALAQAVGLGSKTWRAYLSTVDQGVAMVHAKDRIGAGPWYNYAGEQVAADVPSLHANGITPEQRLTETGATVPASEHDILTGSNANGEALLERPAVSGSNPPNCQN